MLVMVVVIEESSRVPEPPKGVAAKALRSGIWLWARQIATNSVSLVTMAILARHLSPKAYGLAALANIVMRFIAMLSKSGVGEYVIVDKKEGNAERANSAFWLNMALTVVVLTGGLLARGWIGDFYEAPILSDLLLVFFFKFFCDQLLIVPDALIRRSLDYQKLVLRDGTLQMMSSIASCVLAILGFGVWSLVLPYLAAQPLRVIIVLAMTRWRPRLHLGVRDWPVIGKFSGNVLLLQVATQIANDSDNLVIGKKLGGAAVGLYNNAWATTGLLTQNTAGIAGTLVLPSLAAAHTDPERLRQAFRRVIRVLAIMSIPPFVGLFVLAEEFVLTLYGPKWMAMVLPLRLLIIFAVRRAIGSPATAIYSVMGRPDIGMRLSVTFIFFYVPCLFIGVQWGIVGVAAAVAISRTLWGFVVFRQVFALVGETSKAMWQQVAPVVWSSLIMGAVVWGVKLGVGQVISLPPIVALVTLAALGVAVWVLLLRTWFAPVRREIMQLGKELNPRVGRVVKRILGG